MFPSGLPGFALLLLRISVALTVLLHGYTRREELAAVALAGVLLLAIALVVGFLTPIVALLAMAVQFVGTWSGGMPILGFVALSILNSLALALLGPGAYSCDAVRFGRRVVELPPEDEE
jgi:hypothetical protein